LIESVVMLRNNNNNNNNINNNNNTLPLSKKSKTEIYIPSVVVAKTGTYRKRSLIGVGRFSQCFCVERTGDKTLWAVKVTPLSWLCNRKNVQAHVDTEIKALEHLRDTGARGIVRIEDHFRDSVNHYIVLELCQLGSLAALIKSKHHLNEDAVRSYMLQLIDAVDDMHERAVMHCDVKPGNILLAGSDKLLIADLDISQNYDARRVHNSQRGTPNYTAPEVVDLALGGARGYGPAIDVWALGATMYTMLYGRAPFHDCDEKKIYSRIVSGFFEFPATYRDTVLDCDVPFQVSERAKDLIGRALCGTPNTRCSTAEMRRHPFFVCQSRSAPQTHPTNMPTIMLAKKDEIKTKNATRLESLYALDPSLFDFPDPDADADDAFALESL